MAAPFAMVVLAACVMSAVVCGASSNPPVGGGAHAHRAELCATARKLSVRGKGILAADESTNTIAKRLAAIDVANTEGNRRAYRGLLFDTPHLSRYISGVILFNETFYQGDFVSGLRGVGVVPGIKVDMGCAPLAGGRDGETWTRGQEGLLERCREYYRKGARFAKWRAVIRIPDGCRGGGDGGPTALAIQENAWGLARYARTCQEAGLVPIVEPEVLMDGDHSLATAAGVQERVLRAVYSALADNNVLLEGTLLKPSMTVPGKQHRSNRRATAAAIGEATVRTLSRSVPAAVPGITFLSGGMTEEEASVNLNAVNVAGQRRPVPWNLSFSFGRALQQSCLRSWKGRPENTEAAQAALMARARANSEAARGVYTAGSQPSAAEGQDLYVKDYTY